MRILVADDRELVRIGLRHVIAEAVGLSLCGEARDGARAVELHDATDPDVTILRFRLPRLSGVQAAAHIRSKAPEAKIVVMAAAGDDVESARRAGASLCVDDTVHAERLMTMIRRLAGGNPRAAGPTLRDMTDREREVLDLIVRGRRNRQIAQALGITEGTVKIHVGNILTKLGVGHRTEAAAVAMERGIVRVHPP